MMKSILISSLVLVSLSAFAAKPAAKVLTNEKFVAEVKDSFQQDFQGELADIGGDCTVAFQTNKEGQVEVVLSSATADLLKIPLATQAKVSGHDDGDGSFQHNYIFGKFEVYRLVITHADDAYDTISLSNGSTTLECGAYY